MSGTLQRANLQLLLAAIAFLAGVVILVVRFGSSAPESAVVPTPVPTATAARRATDIPPTTAPLAVESPGVPTATVDLPGTPLTLPIVQAPVVSPAPTDTVVATILIPTLPPAPVATVAPLTPTNTVAASVVPATASATIMPSPILTVTSGASPAPSATATARATPSPSATARVSPSPSATPGASLTPTATPDEGVRTLVFLVDGTQPKAEILYEINGQEFIAGNIGEVGLPWTITVQVLIGSEARILADGIEENGDLRCQITGDLVPTPGIIDYDPNPYPQVECLLLVP